MTSLDELFALQRALQEKLGHDFGVMEAEDRADYARSNVLAGMVEFVELLDTTPWKYWATYEKGTWADKDRYLKELVDIHHFFMNLALVGQITAEEVSEAYLRKNKINQQRWAEGYAGHGKPGE